MVGRQILDLSIIVRIYVPQQPYLKMSKEELNLIVNPDYSKFLFFPTLESSAINQRRLLTLTPRERTVYDLYTCGGANGLTLKETANAIGYSIRTVSRVQKSALDKLDGGFWRIWRYGP